MRNKTDQPCFAISRPVAIDGLNSLIFFVIITLQIKGRPGVRFPGRNSWSGRLKLRPVAGLTIRASFLLTGRGLPGFQRGLVLLPEMSLFKPGLNYLPGQNSLRVNSLEVVMIINLTVVKSLLPEIKIKLICPAIKPDSKSESLFQYPSEFPVPREKQLPERRFRL